MRKRGYRQTRRAGSKAATRHRIVEAAVALHTSIGPARTTISAVAEKAGVSRPTVYRHFPDLPSLFAACMSHEMAADPMPQPSAWTEIQDPRERLRRGLVDLYGYYRRNQAINLHTRRDTELLRLIEDKAPSYLERRGPNIEPKVLQIFRRMRPMAQARDAAILETLVAPWEAAGWATRGFRHALAVAVSFQTWAVLARDEGLDDATAAAVAARMVEALAAPPKSR